MKLTPAQVDELKRLAREPQNTYGKARVRVQNNLHRLGLAHVGGSWCEITNEGRSALWALDHAAPRLDVSCSCGHAPEEHGHDPEYPGSTACTADGCECIAYEAGE